MLVVFLLFASFVLMVTAVTHQFRGWLFSLMTNKRRRRTIIALLTGGFILLVQLPNLINVTVWRNRRGDEPDRFQVALGELDDRYARGEVEDPDYQTERSKLMAEGKQYREEQRGKKFTSVVRTAKVVNAVLPIGWLPYGVFAAAQGSLWPGLFGALGATAIGLLSLRRTYRATLRFYTAGDRPGGPPRKKPLDKERPPKAAVDEYFVEKKLPWISDQAAVVCLASLRSLLRAPGIEDDVVDANHLVGGLWLDGPHGAGSADAGRRATVPGTGCRQPVHAVLCAIAL